MTAYPVFCNEIIFDGARVHPFPDIQAYPGYVGNHPLGIMPDRIPVLIPALIKGNNKKISPELSFQTTKLQFVVTVRPSSHHE